MKAAHEKGTPVIRPLFYDFPNDENAWHIEDVYMLGPKYLVAPIMEAGQRKREVYLPKGVSWKSWETGEVHTGGNRILVDAPLENIPVFERF
jgi:alpha-D-xyloside xylohydrolase